MDPWPLTYSWGDDEDAITRQHLIYLEEVIQYEGPHTIAAMIIETVVGTNGILPPPQGWLKGLRALLDKYGILLICDEVMCGFGRTGRWFAFEHGDIVPDIVTMAKGLTSSYLPLGAVGLRQPIADHFRKSVFWGGLTYNSHPLLMGTALAVLDVMAEEGIVEHAAEMEHVMRAEMQGAQRPPPHGEDLPRHRSVRHGGSPERQQRHADGALQRQPPGDGRLLQTHQGAWAVHGHPLWQLPREPAAHDHPGGAA
jgi:adenosylmethionine-8-amino-7-oxononanoate aminotransferase